MKKIITIIFLMIATSGAYAGPELKGSPEELRKFLHSSEKIVSIFAEAEENAYSDKAIISLVISTEDKKLSDALSMNSELRKSITKQLVESGIDKDHIKSSRFSTSPQYGWLGKRPTSYKVVNRMAVSITNEKQLWEIAAVADSKEEIELSDTTFEHTQKDETETMVKEQALAKVMQQKALYEKTLGIKLIPVGFRNEHVGHSATRGAMFLEEVVVTAQKRTSSHQDVPMSMSAYDAKTESSFDEVKYEAGIYVDFKIEDAAK